MCWFPAYVTDWSFTAVAEKAQDEIKKMIYELCEDLGWRVLTEQYNAERKMKEILMVVKYAKSPKTLLVKWRIYTVKS